MTFKDFEQLVLQKHPNAKVFKHGEFSGSKINVAVVFNYGLVNESKVYRYQGSYCYVLNKLGIKAIYKHDVCTFEDLLSKYKQWHGQDGWFGVQDYTNEIRELEQKLQDIYTNCIIVD